MNLQPWRCEPSEANVRDGSIASMSRNNIDRSDLEPRPENLRFARLVGQGLVATFGLVPLWFAVDLASSSRWGFAALMMGVGVTFELAAFWLIPVVTGVRGPFRKR